MKTTKKPKAKLTLSIKKSVLEQARKFAVQNGTSLSAIFEDLFVEYEKNNRVEDNDFLKSLPNQLMGCAKNGPLSNMTDDEIKNQMIKDRYDL